MKKISLAVMLLISSFLVNAQTDSLQVYTGRYKFPEGTPISILTISILDGGLIAESDAGSSTLTRTQGDVFSVDAYAGVASFLRNTEQKITGVRLEVQEYIMEGSKMENLIEIGCSLFPAYSKD